MSLYNTDVLGRNLKAELGKRPEGVASSVFIHPMALVESTDVGPNTRIWGFSHIMNGAQVGADCNIGEQVFVEAGAIVGSGVTIKNGVQVWDRVSIGDRVFVGPNATFTNDLWPRAEFKKSPDEFLGTQILEGSTIGANATVVCGVTIGKYAFIGAGAVVTKDVPDHALVVGNPLRTLGFICKCTRSRNATLKKVLECPDCSSA